MKLNVFAKNCCPQKTSKKRVLPLWISCSLFLLIQSCAGPRYTLSPDIPFYPPAGELVDSLEHFKGAGDIDLLADGDYNRAKIATRVTSATHLQAEIYSVFGGTVARILAEQDSVFIDIGERTYRIRRDEGLEKIAFLRKYPFTFNQFARIITGRSMHNQLLVTPADSVWMEKRSMFYMWRTDSVEIVLQGSRRRRKIQQIAYNSLLGPRWKLILSDLEEGIAKEIRLHIGNDNYFKINYNRVCLNPEGC